MRELISGFWDEGGGGLELSIDACDEVLASLCRYMHTGLLVLPVRLHRQLELLRVSSELGMNSLYLSACEALLQKLTMDCVPAVISFCADHQFSDLERSCRTFLTSGGRRAPVIRYQPAGDQNPQNAYLRDAIFASLQDVNAVLNQHPHSQAKLRVAAPSGQQSALTAVPIQTAPSVRSLHPHSPAAELSAQSSTQRDGQQNSYYSNEVDDSFGLNSASLLDLAAGRGAGLSMSREDFSHGDNNVNAFQTDYLEELAQAGGSAFSHAVEYTASSSFSTANNNPPRAGPRTDKPRAGSGGIYGLLLQGATGSAAAVAVPTKAANVPGKVVATEKRPGSAGTNPKSKLALAVNKEKAAAAARAGTAPAAASGRPGSARTNDPPTIATAAADATPRTQRASSLLASARPRHSAYLDGEDSSSHSNAYNQLSGDDFDGRDYYGGGSVIPIGEEADWRGDASFVDSQDGAFGPQEFSTRMSLAPQRDKTPNEKRFGSIDNIKYFILFDIVTRNL